MAVLQLIAITLLYENHLSKTLLEHITQITIEIKKHSWHVWCFRKNIFLHILYTPNISITITLIIYLLINYLIRKNTSIFHDLSITFNISFVFTSILANDTSARGLSTMSNLKGKCYLTFKFDISLIDLVLGTISTFICMSSLHTACFVEKVI